MNELCPGCGKPAPAETMTAFLDASERRWHLMCAKAVLGTLPAVTPKAVTNDPHQNDLNHRRVEAWRRYHECKDPGQAEQLLREASKLEAEYADAVCGRGKSA